LDHHVLKNSGKTPPGLKASGLKPREFQGIRDSHRSPKITQLLSNSTHQRATPGSNGAPAQQGQLPYGKPREHQHHLMREMAGVVDETMVKQ